LNGTTQRGGELPLFLCLGSKTVKPLDVFIKKLQAPFAIRAFVGALSKKHEEKHL
jgi:hypothetical protein